MKKLLATIAVALAVMFLSSVCSAATIALQYDDAYFLGIILPDSPANETNEQGYVNYLKGLAPSTTQNYDGRDYWRSANSFGSLPNAENGYKPANYTQPLSLAGLTYVLGKYGQDGFVWYVGGLYPTYDYFTVPNEIKFEIVTGSKKVNIGGGLSHVTTFGGYQVPDGGLTLVLLGCSFAGLVALSRKFHN